MNFDSSKRASGASILKVTRFPAGDEQKVIQERAGLKEYPSMPAWLEAANGQPRGDGVFAVKPTVLIGGGGVTATHRIIKLTELLSQHERALQQLKKSGVPFDAHLRFINLEKSADYGGYAFGPGQAGTANTPLEDDRKLITDTIDWVLRHEAEILKSDHPVGATLLADAKKLAPARLNGQPLDDQRALIERRFMGEVDHWRLIKAAQDATERFPNVDFALVYNTVAKDIVPSIDDGAKVLVGPADQGGVQGDLEIEAGHVGLHPGPQLRPAVGPDHPAYPFVYQGVMDGRRIQDAMRAQGLLDENGHLLEGKKIFVGGLKLSALDTMVAFNRVMPVLVPDGKGGYTVDEEVAKKYQGALTTINREGLPPVPRYVYSPSSMSERVLALGTTEELLALFTHENGSQVYKAWHTLERAVLASALGTTPDKLEQRIDNEALIRIWHAQTQKVREIERQAGEMKNPADMEAKLKERLDIRESMERLIYLRTIIGAGMEKNLAEAFGSTAQSYPALFDGRMGYPFHRAQPAGVTDATQITGPNKDLMDVQDRRMQPVTASPYQVHDVIALLMKAGVLMQLNGTSYMEFEPSQEGGRALRHTKRKDCEFDYGLISPTFQVKSPVVKAVGQRVETALKGVADVDPQEAVYYPKLRKNLLLEDKETGVPLPVDATLLSGKGWTQGMNTDRQTTYADVRTDLNNKESALETAASLASRDLCLAILNAKGVSNPHRTLEGLYMSFVPDDRRYGEEVKRLEQAFDTAMAKSECLKAFMSQVAAGRGDTQTGGPVALTYGDVRVRADSAERAFEDAVTRLATDPVFRDAVVAHYKSSPAYQRFTPPKDMDSYERRFVDYPPHIHKQVLQSVINIGLGRERL